MFTNRNECPVCHASVADWSARCPKCRYHPDCDDRDCYNRAQDDVALIARYPGADRPGRTGRPTRWALARLFRRPLVTG